MEGRKEGRLEGWKDKDGQIRKGEERKEGRKEGREEGRLEGRKDKDGQIRKGEERKEGGKEGRIRMER